MIDTGGGGFSGSSASRSGDTGTGSNYQGGFNVNHNSKIPWYGYVSAACLAAGLGYLYLKSKQK